MVAHLPAVTSAQIETVTTTFNVPNRVKVHRKKNAQGLTADGGPPAEGPMGAGAARRGAWEGAPAPPRATAAAVGMGVWGGGREGWIDWGGDTSGYYTKPQKIIQRLKILYTGIRYNTKTSNI